MTKKENRNHEPSEIDVAASEWIARLDRGLSDAGKEELKRWLEESPKHQAVFNEFQQNWDDLDRLAGFHVVYSSKEDPSLLVHDQSKPSGASIWNHWRVLSAMAALLLLSFSVILFQQLTKSEVRYVRNTDNILVERIDSLDLEDGSQIQLNRGSLVSVEYSDEIRLVKLLSGEANFIVARNDQLPFVVEVSGIRVRAVGTVFNIRTGSEQIEVIVSEGTVALQSDLGHEFEETSNETLVEENHMATYDLASSASIAVVEKLDPVKVEEALIWQPKFIEFEDVYLGDIIDEFNRRNSVKMRIIDESIRTERLSTMFWSDNVNGFIRLLQSSLNIHAEWGEDGTIYLFENNRIHSK